MPETKQIQAVLPPDPKETPEQKKQREETQKMALEMSAIERTTVVLTAGIDFVARQMCRADEAAKVGEFLGYLRDLKRDMKQRSQVLKEALKISRENPVITESQLKEAGVGAAVDNQGNPTKAPELAGVPA